MRVWGSRRFGGLKNKTFASCAQTVSGLAGLALSTLAILSVTIIPARAISLNDGALPVGGIGAYYDVGNLFPFVASTVTMQPNSVPGGPDVATSHCTGTLINARTILTAAHCFYNAGVFDGGPTATDRTTNQTQTVSFKPVATAGDTAGNDRTVTSIVIHKQYTNGEANDIALITLSAPVTTIDPVTLATPSTPIAVNGQTIIMAGYGEKGSGTSCCTPTDNKRRVAYGELGGLFARNTVAGFTPSTVTQQFYFAQFRNPNDRNNPNTYGVTTPTNPYEGATGRGDSGGPLFTYINGQLVQLGELLGGENPVGRPSEYGDIGYWTPVAAYTDWLAANNPLRTVSAKAGNYNWSNAAAWQDSVAGVAARTPSNFVGNVFDYQTDLAYYYNVALSNPGTVTVDIDPTVDTLAITGAQSQLTIPTGRVLTTEISTSIASGTAFVAGTLASPKVTLTGGMLTGSGTVKGIGVSGTTALLNNGGTVAPLNALTVAGNFTQTAGTLQTRIDATGTSDYLSVTGIAALGGTYKALLQAGLYNTTTTGNFLSSGTRTGTFATVMSSSPFFTAAATYTGTNVDVTLTRIGFGAAAGLTPDQRAVGTVLEQGYSTTATGNAATFYANLNAAQSPNALTNISGAATGVAQTVATTGGSMFMSAMMDQASGWRDGGSGTVTSAPLGYAAEKKSGTDAFASIDPAPRRFVPRTWQAYGAGFGGWQSMRADATGNNGSSQTVGGGAIGVNYQGSADMLIGFSAGVGSSSFASGNSNGDATTGQFGLYGVRTFNAFYVAGAINYGFGKVNTSRTISGLGPTETATGSFNSNQLGGRIEIGHRFVMNGYGVTPFSALQVAKVWQQGYSETSVTTTGAPGVFGLTFGSQSTTSLPSFLGVQVDNRVAIGSTLWTPTFRASWVHEFRPQTQVTAGFNTLPGTGFTVEGPRAAENALRLDLGSTLAFNDRISLFGKVTSEFSDRGQSFAGNGGIKVAW